MTTLLAILMLFAPELPLPELTKEERIERIIVQMQELNSGLMDKLATIGKENSGLKMETVELKMNLDAAHKATQDAVNDLGALQTVIDNAVIRADNAEAGEARAWSWWRWAVGYAASVTVALVLCVYILFKP